MEHKYSLVISQSICYQVPRAPSSLIQHHEFAQHIPRCYTLHCNEITLSLEVHNHPPTAICSGRNNDDDDNDGKPFLLVMDPNTGHGFVSSRDQTALGCPEFLFLDAPGDKDIMVSCSKIFLDYTEANQMPNKTCKSSTSIISVKDRI